MKCRVEARTTRQVEFQRENDKYLMQIAMDGNLNLRLIQQCRLWLQVCTLADICDASGRKVEKWALAQRGWKSVLKWVRQGEPSARAWREWRRMLKSLVTVAGNNGGRHLKHTYKMTVWYNTHQKWEWMGNEKAVIGRDGQRFWREGTSLRPMSQVLQYVPQRLYPVGVHGTRPCHYQVRDPGLASLP